MHQRGLLWPIEDAFVRARFNHGVRDLIVCMESTSLWSIQSRGEGNNIYFPDTKKASDESRSVQYAGT